MTPIVYLHGFASSPLSSKAQFFRRRFEQRGVEVEIPQLDGGDFANLTVTGQMAVIKRAVAGRRVVLMGSSLGGYLAALYAFQHPEEVEKLVLLAPALNFPERFPQRFSASDIVEWESHRSKKFFHYGEKREVDLNYRIVEDARKYPSLPEFRQPALILHGTRDEVVAPSISQRFAAGHPNVQLRLLESGHELTDVLEVLWSETEMFLGFQKL
jgi:pimeloyl-ACP methyl ester carboxylesterase